MIACVAHPGRYSLAHAMLKGEAEGAVTPVAALVGQLLGNDGLPGCDSLVIESYEVIDAEIVDISIVSSTLTGEILAEIIAVGANGLSQLLKGQVVL